MEIIQSRRDCVEIGRSSSYGNDLLGMLLNEMQKKKDGNGLSLNLQIIMDECKTFFFAGHETTALLLTWTVMLLATNPSWQQKVRAEVMTVCNGQTPSLDHLSKLSLVLSLFQKCYKCRQKYLHLNFIKTYQKLKKKNSLFFILVQ